MTFVVYPLANPRAAYHCVSAKGAALRLPEFAHLGKLAVDVVVRGHVIVAIRGSVFDCAQALEQVRGALA